MDSNSSFQEGQGELLDYWRLVKSRWGLILTVLAVAVCLAAVFSSLQPKVYSASTRIKLESDSATTLVYQNQQGEGNYLQNQVQIIRSQRILYPVVEKLNLCQQWAKPGSSILLRDSIKDKVFHPLLVLLHLEAPQGPKQEISMDQAFDQLDGQVLATRSGDSSLITITAYDSDPKRAAEIANTVAEAYESERREGKRQLTRRNIENLDKELASQEKQLQVAQEKVEKLRKELNVPRFADSRPTDVAAQQLEQDIAVQKTQLVSQETRLKELQRLTPEQRRNAIATLINDPNLTKFLQDLNDTELKLAVLRKGYGPDHPNVKEAEAARDKLAEQLDSRMDGVMRSFDLEYKMAQAKVQQMEKHLADVKLAINALDDVAYLPYRNALRAEESERRVYETILTKQKQNVVELGASRSPVEVIDRAQPSYQPIKPKPGRTMMMGILGGLFIGIAIVFLIEFLNPTLKKIEDVEKYLDLPVLGVVPREVGLISRGDGSVRHIEVYRMLRAGIEFAKGGGPVKSLCVLSAGAGEGKSLTTSNLACVTAQHGLQVLVIDCDLHRPSIHNYLNTTNEIGLADYLDSSKTADEVIHASEVPNLSVIPAGTGTHRNGRFPTITAQKLRNLIQGMERKFDIVIYDTPPILAVSDASVIAREVGASIMVVQHRRYPRNMEQRALKVVRSAGANLLGVVVNRVGVGHADLDYYYQSDYTNYTGAPEHRAEALAETPKTEAQS